MWQILGKPKKKKKIWEKLWEWSIQQLREQKQHGSEMLHKQASHLLLTTVLLMINLVIRLMCFLKNTTLARLMMHFWIPVRCKKFLILKDLITSRVVGFLICHQKEKKHIRNSWFMVVKYDIQRKNVWSFWHIKLKNENFVYVTQLFNLYEYSYLPMEHKVRQRSYNRGCAFNLNDYVFPLFSKQIDPATKKKFLNSKRGSGTWTTRWS